MCRTHTRTHTRHKSFFSPLFLSHPVLTASHLLCLIVARQQTTPSFKSATITMQTTRCTGGQRCHCQSSPSNITQGRSPTRYRHVLSCPFISLTDVSSIFIWIQRVMQRFSAQVHKFLDKNFDTVRQDVIDLFIQSKNRVRHARCTAVEWRHLFMSVEMFFTRCFCLRDSTIQTAKSQIDMIKAIASLIYRGQWHDAVLYKCVMWMKCRLNKITWSWVFTGSFFYAFLLLLHFHLFFQIKNLFIHTLLQKTFILLLILLALITLIAILVLQLNSPLVFLP